MEPEQTTPSAESLDKFENLKKVTPLSKHLAMFLFIIMPFVGGWVGYTYAPEKVIEIEKIVEVERSTVKDIQEKQETQQDLSIYQNQEFGFEMQMTKKWIANMQVEVSESHLYGTNIFFKLQSRNSGEYQPVCYVSVSTQEEWSAWQKEEIGKPTYLASSTNLIFGYGCGHDDSGYIGFEEFDTAIAEGRFGDVNSGLILGPFQEFRKSVKETFRVTRN